MAIEETSIAENLARVRSRVAAAAQRAGREAESVRVVAVTKNQPLERVRRAYTLGVRDLGENRVEEALPRQQALADLPGLRWHMIGHVQSRKARQVPGAFVLVHSVDRWKIAQAFDRHAAAAGLRLPVLLECNVSGEATKEGWAFSDRGRWDEMLTSIEGLCALPRLEVLGLMTMAPWTDRPETVRPAFSRLRELRDFLAARLPGPWSELSMGMTDDFEVAIEEGATIVRIGRAIFGERMEDAAGQPVVR
jgi:pyridoxal phosphate enzyme (YggS family)